MNYLTTAEALSKQHPIFSKIWVLLTKYKIVNESVLGFVIALLRGKHVLTCFHILTGSVSSEVYLQEYELALDESRIIVLSAENRFVFDLRRIKITNNRTITTFKGGLEVIIS